MGRFPVFTDNHVQTSVIHGLRQRGWSVVRAVDVFPENTVASMATGDLIRAGHAEPMDAAVVRDEHPPIPRRVLVHLRSARRAGGSLRLSHPNDPPP